ncbi:DUF2642 domain-containing protein [Terrilactibacillus tamarindi]|uniref:DUF2642 domain-containing protein n=1 Tax=Terrilactibacillus tamarindi TaxID=2599694 RepID=UPI0012BB644C|nr:DUF2642 domain-containing protein [Terrilactibacillus tamarindi]
MALTREQRLELLQRLLRLSQSIGNTTSSSGAGLSIDTPIFDLNFDLNIPGLGGGSTPSTPSTIPALLATLVNEQVVLSTPGGTVSGTLISVQTDYVVVVQADGTLNLVPLSKIQTVREL